MQVTARQAKRGQENAEAAALPAPALVAREIPITLARDLFPLSDGKSPRDSPALPSLSRLLQGCMAALPSLLGRTSWSDRFPPVYVAAIHPLAACTRASRESSPLLLSAIPCTRHTASPLQALLPPTAPPSLTPSRTAHSHRLTPSQPSSPPSTSLPTCPHPPGSSAAPARSSSACATPPTWLTPVGAASGAEEGPVRYTSGRAPPAPAAESESALAGVRAARNRGESSSSSTWPDEEEEEDFSGEGKHRAMRAAPARGRKGTSLLGQ